MSQANLTGKVGGSASLSATITPSNATNKTVLWATTDYNVVSITQTGALNFLKEGSVVITALSDDDLEIKDYCNVTVTSGSGSSAKACTPVQVEKIDNKSTTLPLTSATMVCPTPTGSSPFTYQWQVRDNENESWRNLTGNSGAQTYKITVYSNGSKDDGNFYHQGYVYFRCKVTNACGTDYTGTWRKYLQ
jgi:hypothetical protein